MYSGVREFNFYLGKIRLMIKVMINEAMEGLEPTPQREQTQTRPGTRVAAVTRWRCPGPYRDAIQPPRTRVAGRRRDWTPVTREGEEEEHRDQSWVDFIVSWKLLFSALRR